MKILSKLKHYSMRPTPKVMPPILLYWPKTSEADDGGMAVEIESSRKYSITFCCCVTDGSRGAVWQNGVWHGSVYETMGWNWIPPCGKNGTHWHLLNVYGDQTVNVGTMRQWVVHFSSGDNNSSGDNLHWCRFFFTSTACRLLFISGENA